MPTCKNCQKSDTYDDPTTGHTICETCGFVLDEVTISTEVDFQESGNGGRGIIGTVVTHGAGYRSGDRFSYRDSRALTLSNSKRMIRDIATGLGMNEEHVEQAQAYYKIALERKFTQGRTQQHVVAACLYLVCRQARTPHILLDFSDILHPQVNVYVLGSTFLKLCRVLNLHNTKDQMPLIDPALYIHRYASKLEFGDQTSKVAETANKIVQRMVRDWIHLGRRPTGICGAALLLAARMHNFSRTVKEVVDVVRVCDVALRKRLEEFGATGSGALTLDLFGEIDLDENEDPPAFTRAKIAAQEKTMLEESDQTEGDVTEQMRSVLSSAEFGTAVATASTQLVPVPRKRAAPTQYTVASDEENLSDVDDDEIAGAILEDHEVEERTKIWTEVNKEYLEQMEEKKRLEEQEAANGHAPQKRKRRKRNPAAAKRQSGAPASSVAEAVGQLVQERKVSKKINYEALLALDELNIPVSTPATESAPMPALPAPSLSSKRKRDEDGEEEEEETEQSGKKRADEDDDAEDYYDEQEGDADDDQALESRLRDLEQEYYEEEEMYE